MLGQRAALDHDPQPLEARARRARVDELLGAGGRFRALSGIDERMGQPDRFGKVVLRVR